MDGQFKLNKKEMEAMKELEMRFKGDLPQRQKEDETLFYRFLKARDFDVDKAETMLRKHLVWRKAFQVDTLHETFKPQEVCQKYFLPSLIGLDKEGNIVRFAPVGKIDPKDIERSMKLNDLVKHFIWLGQHDEHYVKQENRRSGKTAYQEVALIDLAALPLASVTSRFALNIFLRLVPILQDNYPEQIRHVFIFNAPAYFTIFYSVLKKIMSKASLQKMHIYGESGWKDHLLEIIDADVLPAFLGGNRTDPDGDPSCKTFIFQGGPIPSKYYLTDAERYFSDLDNVKKIEVSPNSDRKILVKVEAYGSVIRWEFEVKHKDIGFGLFHQKSEGELEEVLPIRRINTNDGTETDSFKCHSTGTYAIIFDNSHSWMNSKEINYIVEVEKPRA